MVVTLSIPRKSMEVRPVQSDRKYDGMISTLPRPPNSTPANPQHPLIKLLPKLLRTTMGGKSGGVVSPEQPLRKQSEMDATLPNPLKSKLRKPTQPDRKSLLIDVTLINAERSSDFSAWQSYRKKLGMDVTAGRDGGKWIASRWGQYAAK